MRKKTNLVAPGLSCEARQKYGEPLNQLHAASQNQLASRGIQRKESTIDENRRVMCGVQIYFRGIVWRVLPMGTGPRRVNDRSFGVFQAGVAVLEIPFDVTWRLAWRCVGSCIQYMVLVILSSG